MKTRLLLLNILADSRFHSGEKLGQQLGISRTAVWKHIQALQQLGIDCYSVSGKGYRLAKPIELLEQQSILDAMHDAGRKLVSQIELHPEIPSTNRYLMDHLGPTMISGHACLVERQTAGRGRRGRPWVSPFARNIYLSYYWRFDISPERLSGLGLAVGVGVIRALNQLGIESAKLKWPNDILWQGRKLAGILLEMSGEMAGPYHVVVGVGLNVNMSDGDAEIDQPWVDLNEIKGEIVSRNRVAGVLLSQLMQVTSEFQQHGLSPFMEEWAAADAFAGQAVLIHMADQQIPGEARGIDASGAILVETEAGLRRFHSGEVSLRPWS